MASSPHLSWISSSLHHTEKHMISSLSLLGSGLWTHIKSSVYSATSPFSSIPIDFQNGCVLSGVNSGPNCVFFLVQYRHTKFNTREFKIETIIWKANMHPNSFGLEEDKVFCCDVLLYTSHKPSSLNLRSVIIDVHKGFLWWKSQHNHLTLTTLR